MDFTIALAICFTVFSNVLSRLTDENYDVITIDKTVFPGNERFPDEIEVHFNYYGSDVHLTLLRDDVMASMLSESVFQASPILPTDIYSDDDSEHFSAYSSSNDDTIIVHRETENAEPKFYGRYTASGKGYVINSVDGSHVLHRVRRDASAQEESNYVDIEMEGDETSRNKRSVTIDGVATDVVEVVLFADYSLFSHFKDNVMQSGKSNNRIKMYMKKFLRAVTAEVDLIYNYLGSYGNVTLRVYFQQYQIITKASHQVWLVKTATNPIPTGATTELATYYDKLVTKFAFPDADHVMAITKYTMEGGAKVMTANNSICSKKRSVSIVDFGEYPVSLAQGIARSFNLTFDGTENACSAMNYNIMSESYGAGTSSASQGNKWMFSTCSITEFETALAKSLTCLQTEDSLTDFAAFLSYPLLSDLYSPDDQCNIQLGSNSTFCTVNSDSLLDCYSTNQGCLNGTSGTCEPSYFAEDTLCDTGPGPNAKCTFGFCLPNVTTTSSTTSTTTSTTVSTTTATESTTTSTGSTNGEAGTTTTAEMSTTPNPDCVVQTGFVEFDLPGCGCCGGCGCDETCGDCPDGIGRPGYTEGDDCTKDSDCCGAKVRISTLFVPDGCDADYEAGPRTIVMEKKGWEQDDLDVTATVYQKENLDWQVQLTPVS